MFDDESVADYFDRQVDQGLQPEQFARVWIHTHPGESPLPSSVDEDTFARCFGACDWSVMFILAEGGATYCRLSFRAGPGGALLLPVEVDYGLSFTASDFEAWELDHREHVAVVDPFADHFRRKRAGARTRPVGLMAPEVDYMADPFFAADDPWLDAWRPYEEPYISPEDDWQLADVNQEDFDHGQ